MPELNVSFCGSADFSAVSMFEDEGEVIIDEFSCVVVDALVPLLSPAGIDQPGLLGVAVLIADAIEVSLVSGDFNVDRLNKTFSTWFVGCSLLILHMVMTTPACWMSSTSGYGSMGLFEYNYIRVKAESCSVTQAHMLFWFVLTPVKRDSFPFLKLSLTNQLPLRLFIKTNLFILPNLCYRFLSNTIRDDTSISYPTFTLHQNKYNQAPEKLDELIDCLSSSLSGLRTGFSSNGDSYTCTPKDLLCGQLFFCRWRDSKWLRKESKVECLVSVFWQWLRHWLTVLLLMNWDILENLQYFLVKVVLVNLSLLIFIKRQQSSSSSQVHFPLEGSPLSPLLCDQIGLIKLSGSVS